MAKFKIEHDKDNCIGCGACAAVAGDYWEMGDDGKSALKGAETNVKEIEEAELGPNKEAAESCPVNVIHITNLETDEKLI